MSLHTIPFKTSNTPIERVGSLRVKGPREKGRIWDKIILIIQYSDLASFVWQERKKVSIQNKAHFKTSRYAIEDETDEEAV